MSGLAGVAPAPRSWENTVVTVSPSPLPAAELAEAPEQQRSATVVEGTSSEIARETLASDHADSWLEDLVSEHGVAHGCEQTPPLTPAADSSSSLSIIPFVALAVDSPLVPPTEHGAKQSLQASLGNHICNMCEGEFARKDGTKKGARWFRCKLCSTAVQRLEYAAKTDSQKSALHKLKRTATEYKVRVLKERQSVARGQLAAAQRGEFLEAGGVELKSTALVCSHRRLCLS